MTSKTPLVRDIFGILLPIGILGLGIGVLVVTIINRPVPARQPKRKNVPTVKTITMERFTGDMTINIDGTVVPYREVNLAAEVAGRIVEKAEHCRAGRYVRAGEQLLTIDPTDYRLEVKRLTQEKRQAEVNLKESQVEIENTQQLLTLAENDVAIQNNDVLRMQKLISRSAVSQTELDRALRGKVTARNAQQIIQNRQRLLAARLDGEDDALGEALPRSADSDGLLAVRHHPGRHERSVANSAHGGDRGARLRRTRHRRPVRRRRDPGAL